MKVKKVILILIAAVFLLQAFPVSVFAEEKCNCIDLSARYKKEKLVLTKSLSPLSSDTAKIGDVLKFKVMENVDFNNKILIPADSIIEGKIVKVRKTYILRSDAFIDILITNIQTVSGCINLEKEPVKLRIADIHYKSALRRLLQRAPVVISGFTTTIVLSQASKLNDVAVVALAFGAGTVMGFISGLIDPDIDKTRFNGAIVRGIEGSPVGTVLVTIQKGYKVDFATDCVVMIKFDDKIKQQIDCALQKAAVPIKSF